MDHPFRTAAVGGFNRQDVLTYLETITREAAEKQARLEAQLEEACKDNEQRAGELDRLRERAEQLEQETADLREQVESRDKELARMEEQQRAAAEEAERIQAENASLREQVESLRPSAEAYDSIKERTAGLELEAHHRAHLVEQEADQQAARIRHEMEEWARKVEREYDSLRTQVEATVSHAVDQLGRAGDSLEQVNRLLGCQDLKLENLMAEYHKAADKAAAGQDGVDRLLSEIAGNAAAQAEN